MQQSRTPRQGLPGGARDHVQVKDMPDVSQKLCKNKSMTVGIVTTKTRRSCRGQVGRKGGQTKGGKCTCASPQPSRALSTLVSGVRVLRGMSERWSGRISELARDTAATTHSVTCGTKRNCNDLEMPESFHRRDNHRERLEVTLVERSSSSRGG